MARISFAAFRRKWLGRSIDRWSSSPSPQCVDLIRQGMIELHGIPQAEMYRAIPRGDARTFFANANTRYYRKVKNTPSGVPPEGAIVVINHRSRGRDGVLRNYGHVFFAKRGSTTTKMLSLDQNWSVRGRVTDEAHRYTGIIGWLIRR